MISDQGMVLALYYTTQLIGKERGIKKLRLNPTLHTGTVGQESRMRPGLSDRCRRFRGTPID